MDALDQKVEIFIYCVPKRFSDATTLTIVSQNTNLKKKKSWKWMRNWIWRRELVHKNSLKSCDSIFTFGKNQQITKYSSRLFQTFFAFAEEVKCPALDM